MFRIAWLFLPGAGTVAAGEIAPPHAAEALAWFEAKIRPVLAEKCYKCHSSRAKKLKANLYLDSREGMLTGGDTGPAIVPGEPEQSLLIEAMRHVNVDLKMPPKEKQKGRIVEDFEKWIGWGALWPPGGETDGAAKKSNGESFDLARRKAEHWAWRPITNPPVPEIEYRKWSKDPIDCFILAKLRENGLTPAAPADKRALIRRLSFDLTGLPPTPAQVEDFLADASSNAYAHVVDSLLESPRFGERWARHWLDLVRYAETRGHEFDHRVPNAFRYRDYVIRAFNSDLPYNQLVIEHIAGDLLPEPRVHPEEGFNESIIGTGFWFLGESIHSPVDIKQDEADRFDNMVDVASKSFLALTVACARCHDHKFDAISTRDYYAMFGYLQSSSYRQAPIDSMLPNKAISEQMLSLAKGTKQAIAEALSEALEPGWRDAAACLRAAVGSEAPGDLDPTRLRRWQDIVHAARDDENDILHAFATDGHGQSAQTANLNKWVARESAAATQLRTQLDTLSMVADYASIDQSSFIQDGGFGFGIAPVRPGGIRLSDDPLSDKMPVARIETHGAARRDAPWSQLKIIDSDLDPASKTSRQPGRMLRTPTFVLKKPGRVHYLVRGRGLAMAVVDSHRLVLGPLHGNVHRQLNDGNNEDDEDELRWEEHGLARYVGHNLHIEFVPDGDNPFEIVMVVQTTGERAALPDPQMIENPPLGALASALLHAKPTPKARAVAFVSFLKTSIDDWRASVGTETAVTAEQARVVDWIVRHPGLFVNDPDKSLDGVRRAIKNFREKQLPLTAKMVMESRAALAMMDGTPFDDGVYIRGSYKSRGDTVPRRFLEALGGIDVPAPEHASGRLELARQITDPRNPFISRAIVNRLWHHLLDRGIVPTTDDFGFLGQRPSHPKLLDHLAHSFIEDGWSIKRQIRRIVMTRVYQLSSQATDPEAERTDPQNVLLHRANVRRLQAESIRDALLAVSGRLDTTPFGRSVPVHLTDFMTGRGRPKDSGPLDGNGRRSIYLEVRRNFLNPMMLAFDTPIPFNAMGRRSVSNVPSQALILMNDPFVIQQADVWARKILSAPELTPAQRVDRMYLEAFARPATPDERSAALAFLEQHAAELNVEMASRQLWADLAHVLFNTKEFIFLN